MTLLWRILGAATAKRHDVAIVDDRRSMTYRELVGAAMVAAEAIDGATSRPHVGILLPTGGGFPVALLGAWLARRTAVPLNYLLSREELHYVIADSDIDTIITAGPMLDYLGGPEALPRNVRLIRLEKLDYGGWPPLRWPPLIRHDELAVLLYTSGTSGRPKGVMLSHGNLLSNVEGAIRHSRITSADTFLGVLPQFHTFGLTACTLLPLSLGAKVIYTARFVPKRVLALMREHRVDVFLAIPSMYGALLGVKDGGSEDLRSLRFPISGGEPLPDAVYEGFGSRFGVQIFEGYGLTETSPVTHWSTPWAYKRYAVGKSLAEVAVAIVDDNGQPLPVNHEGEILLQGPNVMQGYYKLPAETEAAFVALDATGPDGVRYQGRFFRTGDIGRVDEEGFLFITGRKKEMLIVGGENVFPREIEEVLNRHASVAASAVIGRTDGVRGEVPVAYVEAVEGQTIDESELRSWCRDHLAGYKVPRQVTVVEKLPRNPTGKILRRELKAQDAEQCEAVSQVVEARA